MSRRRLRRHMEQREVLTALIRWAQTHPHGTFYPAGPTTDPATVADRIMRGGRIKVKTRGMPADFWTKASE